MLRHRRRSSPLGWILFVIIIVSISHRARSEPATGLVHANVTGYVGALNATGAGRTWTRPLPDTSVLSCPPGTPAASCVWGNAAFAYRKFGDLAADALVNTCAAAIEPGPFAPPNRSGVDPACGDPCGCGDAKDKKVNVLKSAVVLDSADLSTFTASSVGGVAPVTTTLAWNVTNVDSCTASGSWTGTRPNPGTQTITGLTASAKYTLTCTAGQVTIGKAALTWTPPSTNDNGTPLTNLAGYRIIYGMAADVLTSVIEIKDPAAAAYTVDGLTAGQTWYFAMRAFNAAGGESINTGVVSKAIAGSPGKTWTKSIDVTVTPAPTIPNPPTGLQVSQPTAYRLDLLPNAALLVAVGTVPLGTPCYPEELLGKNRVDNATVKLDSGNARPNVAVATCLQF